VWRPSKLTPEQIEENGWKVVAFYVKATSPKPRSRAAWVSAVALSVSGRSKSNNDAAA
jgi:hypothetical protein